MRTTTITLAIAAALTASGAAAQTANLSGAYRCVEACRDGMVGHPAFITQNGDELNLVNEVGQPSRAWPDWSAPNRRIWADAWDVSAVYSPDGMTLQFDNGTIWARDLGPAAPPAVVVVPRRMSRLR
jgi:hypothetical protein